MFTLNKQTDTNMYSIHYLNIRTNKNAGICHPGMPKKEAEAFVKNYGSTKSFTVYMKKVG